MTQDLITTPATNARSAALDAIAGILTKCTSLFPKFSEASAKAYRPLFELALIGEDPNNPRFSGDEIIRGFTEWAASTRSHRPPMPAEIVAAIAKSQADRRPQQPQADRIAFERKPRCHLCGAESDGREFGQGALVLYRDAGTAAERPWQRSEITCGHSAQWLTGLNAEGYSTLSQLPVDERHRATGGKPLEGKLGAHINALGDAMNGQGDRHEARP